MSSKQNLLKFVCVFSKILDVCSSNLEDVKMKMFCVIAPSVIADVFSIN